MADNETKLQEKFYVKDCALAAIATGQRAGSLIEFRDKLAIVPTTCLYYHFWGGRLNSQLFYPEEQNDFAIWAHHILHDAVLAERLGVIDPTEYITLEDLRQTLLGIVEDRIEEKEVILWMHKERQFHFIRSKTIVFDTSYIMTQPNELPHVIANLTTSSIFYHFIDARRRTAESIDDFSLWLQNFGDPYQELIHKIRAVDLYFLSLEGLKHKLKDIIRDYLK